MRFFDKGNAFISIKESTRLIVIPAYSQAQKRTAHTPPSVERDIKLSYATLRHCETHFMLFFDYFKLKM
jgi:hypothetical protein